MNRFVISQAIDTLIVRIEEAQTLAEQLNTDLMPTTASCQHKSVILNDIRHDASLPKIISDLAGLADILDRALIGSLPDHFDRLQIADFKVNTSHVHPPIPVRDFDWSATFDGYEPGGPIGWGRTEEEAIADLRQKREDEA
jgi:hypothetical protein